MNKLFFVFWPSFLIAGIAEIIFFTVVDPQELYLFGQPVTFSALATYSIGFFAFWAICAASSYSTCFFQRSSRDINDETIEHTKPGA
ncbi:MAG: hypothetical protein KJ634_14510 [Gammaproteobacteria bacterium]|nr:hypothetical protein [Gammaproteobacteria bacterium]MBU1416826.1 hypothetical protein [Gammaproteobacteria bacterium]